MAVESSSDRAGMLDDWDEALYTDNQYPHPSSITTTINGIFDREYVEINGVESYSPVFICQSSDVPNANHGARMTINSIVYTVVGVQPDGAGISMLILELYDRPISRA